MARAIMGGDFKAIRRSAPAPVAEQPDPRLALVDLFAGTHVVPVPAPAEPEHEQIAQEPAEEPQEDGTQDSPAEPDTAAEPEPVAENEDAEAQPETQPQDEKDYDPIAAVLG